MKRPDKVNEQVKEIANTLLEHFYLDELLSDEGIESLEEKGISPDSMGEYVVDELPERARLEVLSLAGKIYESLSKNGYAYSYPVVDSSDSLLFVATKDKVGVDSVLLIGDLQRDQDNVRVIADNTLSDLERLYHETNSDKAKKAIVEEAKNWIDKTPYAEKVAPTLYEILKPEMEETLEENHDLALTNLKRRCNMNWAKTFQTLLVDSKEAKQMLGEVDFELGRLLEKPIDNFVNSPDFLTKVSPDGVNVSTPEDLEALKGAVAVALGRRLKRLPELDRGSFLEEFNFRLGRYLDSPTAVFSKEELLSAIDVLENDKALSEIKVDKSLFFKGEENAKGKRSDEIPISWVMEYSAEEVIKDGLEELQYERDIVPLLEELRQSLAEEDYEKSREALTRVEETIRGLKENFSVYPRDLILFHVKDVLEEIKNSIEEKDFQTAREILEEELLDTSCLVERVVDKNWEKINDVETTLLEEDLKNNVIPAIEEWLDSNRYFLLVDSKYSDIYGFKDFNTLLGEYDLGGVYKIEYDKEKNTLTIEDRRGNYLEITPLADLEKDELNSLLEDYLKDPYIEDGYHSYYEPSFGGKTFELLRDEEKALEFFSKEELLALVELWELDDEYDVDKLVEKAKQFKEQKLEFLLSTEMKRENDLDNDDGFDFNP